MDDHLSGFSVTGLRLFGFSPRLTISLFQGISNLHMDRKISRKNVEHLQISLLRSDRHSRIFRHCAIKSRLHDPVLSFGLFFELNNHRITLLDRSCAD
jgi:hypothetical protein